MNYIKCSILHILFFFSGFSIWASYRDPEIISSVGYTISRLDTFSFPKGEFDAFYAEGIVAYRENRTIYLYNIFRHYALKIDFECDIVYFHFCLRPTKGLYVKFYNNIGFFSKTYAFAMFDAMFFPDADMTIKKVPFQTNDKHSFCVGMVGENAIVILDTLGNMKEHVFQGAIKDSIFLNDNTIKVSFQDGTTDFIVVPPLGIDKRQNCQGLMRYMRQHLSNNALCEVQLSSDNRYIVVHEKSEKNYVKIYDKTLQQLLYTCDGGRRVNFFELYTGEEPGTHYVLVYCKERAEGRSFNIKKLVKITKENISEIDLLTLTESARFVIVHKKQSEKLLLFDKATRHEICIKDQIYANKSVKNLFVRKNNEMKEAFFEIIFEDAVVLFDVKRRCLEPISARILNTDETYMVYKKFDGSITVQDFPQKKMLCDLNHYIAKIGFVHDCYFCQNAFNHHRYLIVIFSETVLLINLDTNNRIRVPIKDYKQYDDFSLFLLGKHGLFLMDKKRKNAVILKALYSFDKIYIRESQNGNIYLIADAESEGLLGACIFKLNKDNIKKTKKLKVHRMRHNSKGILLAYEDGIYILYSRNMIEIWNDVTAFKEYSSAFCILYKDKPSQYFDTNFLEMFTINAYINGKKNKLRYNLFLLRSNTQLCVKVADGNFYNEEVMEVEFNHDLMIDQFRFIQKGNVVFLLCKDNKCIPKDIKMVNLTGVKKYKAIFAFMDTDNREICKISSLYNIVFSHYEHNGIYGFKIVLPEQVNGVKGVSQQKRREVCQRYRNSIPKKESSNITGRKRSRSELSQSDMIVVPPVPNVEGASLPISNRTQSTKLQQRPRLQQNQNISSRELSLSSQMRPFLPQPPPPKPGTQLQAPSQMPTINLQFSYKPLLVQFNTNNILIDSNASKTVMPSIIPGVSKVNTSNHKVDQGEIKRILREYQAYQQQKVDRDPVQKKRKFNPKDREGKK